MAREKTTGFYFKMSPEENEWFKQRMAVTGKIERARNGKQKCTTERAECVKL